MTGTKVKPDECSRETWCQAPTTPRLSKEKNDSAVLIEDGPVGVLSLIFATGMVYGVVFFPSL